MRVLSLCTEYGSEVQAFKDRGHEVELLGLVGENLTYRQDVRTFHPTKYYDFITAHPDCKQFSKANWRAGKCKDRKPDMSIVQACQRIIKEADPRWHMIENPYFQSSQKNVVPKGHHNITAYTNGTRRGDQRALVPYNLSLALCIAMENELV